MNQKALAIQYVILLLLALGALAVALVFVAKIKTVAKTAPFTQADFCEQTGKTWVEYEQELKESKNKEPVKKEMIKCFPDREEEIRKQ